jgi:hypothetical protein
LTYEQIQQLEFTINQRGHKRIEGEFELAKKWSNSRLRRHSR